MAEEFETLKDIHPELYEKIKIVVGGCKLPAPINDDLPMSAVMATQSALADLVITLARHTDEQCRVLGKVAVLSTSALCSTQDSARYEKLKKIQDMSIKWDLLTVFSERARNRPEEASPMGK